MPVVFGLYIRAFKGAIPLGPHLRLDQVDPRLWKTFDQLVNQEIHRGRDFDLPPLPSAVTVFPDVKKSADFLQIHVQYFPEKLQLPRGQNRLGAEFKMDALLVQGETLRMSEDHFAAARTPFAFHIVE